MQGYRWTWQHDIACEEIRATEQGVNAGARHPEQRCIRNRMTDRTTNVTERSALADLCAPEPHLPHWFIVLEPTGPPVPPWSCVERDPLAWEMATARPPSQPAGVLRPIDLLAC